MKAKWDPLTMGDLPFLLCYASCGFELQYFVIMRNTNAPQPVLIALAGLHNLGFVHRDVRWPNVLKSNKVKKTPPYHTLPGIGLFTHMIDCNN